jgi:hypothetical protein
MRFAADETTTDETLKQPARGARTVCKLRIAVVKQRRCLQQAEGITLSRMTIPERNVKFSGILLFLAFTLLIGFAAPQAQQSPAPATTSAPSDFEFSVYFTGNVRGNLEPCG